jgi:hypothetical protein
MVLYYLARVLEWIFFIGLAGSLMVSILAFVGDLHVFFDSDEESDGRALAPGSASADD